LQQAEVQVNAAGREDRLGGGSSPDGASLDVVDLTAEMVALMSTQSVFEGNLGTLKTADQMQKGLIDLTA
jgi:flagellar hook protein FlgE